MDLNLFPVALAACPNYTQPIVDDAVAKALEASQIKLTPGSTILIKPNLLRPHALTCTSPQVILAACKYFKEFNLNIQLGDSPGFGSAKSVAAHIGLTDLLAPLGIKVMDLNQARKVYLPRSQTHLNISRLALEADLILSLPRIKAHQQMGLSIAVKNCFGCIAGLGKARVHSSHGASHAKFARLIMELFETLPPVAALADGVTAMHVTGPSGGKPYQLGLIAASNNAQALDAAIYCLMGLSPQEVPLWLEALNLGLPGAHPKQLSWPLLPGTDFDLTNFILPPLASPSFHPWFLLKSSARRIWARVKAVLPLR